MEEELLEYDNLSFSNFSISQEDNNESSVMMQSPRNSFSSVENEEFFEFSTTTPSAYSSPDMVFCGKIVHEEDHQLNDEYRKRDYVMNINITEEKVVLAGKDINIRSSSTDHRSMSSSSSSSSMKIKRNSSYNNHGIQKVNITALTSMSSKSRRRMFMFGPVKFHPEMELSALKERQSRGRIPTTMFPPPPPPPPEKTELVSTGAADGEGNKPTRGKSRSNWGLLVRSLKGRSPISTVLAKSLGCMMTPAGVGVEKLIRVAN